MKHILLASAGMLLLNACASAAPETVSTASPPASQFATASHTSAPAPTRPPAATPSPLPTAAMEATGAAPGPACDLNWQFPVNGTKLEPRTDFTVRWNVTNTGGGAWEPGAVRLEFVGGTAMHFSPVLALPERVAPGQSITLSVDMKALRNTSSYVTTWALHHGETYFCTLSAMIYVQWENDSERNW